MFYVVKALRAGVKQKRSFCATHRRWALMLISMCSVVWVSSVYANADVVREDSSALTLNTAIQRTLAHNPALAVFRFRDAYLLGRLDTAQLRPALELSIEAENIGGSGDYRLLDSAELTVSLSSVIELGGKRDARGDVISRYRSHVTAEQEVAALDVLAHTTFRYIDVLAEQERLALAKKGLTLADEAYQIVTARAQAGATPEVEVNRAKVAHAQAKLVMLSEQQQLDYLRVALASMWGDQSLAYTHLEGNLYEVADTVDFNTLYSRVKSNPAIHIFASQARIKDAEIRLAKTQSKQDLRWSVGVRRLQETQDSAITAGFSLPLFAAKRNNGAVASALAERHTVDAEREVALLSLHQQLYRAYSNRKQALLTSHTLRRDVIPALNDVLIDIQAAYQRGRYSYLDYVTAQQELLSAERALIDAASAALHYGAEIEQLTAEPLTLNNAYKP